MTTRDATPRVPVDTAQRALAVATGAVLFREGFTLHVNYLANAGLTGILAQLLLYLTGLVCLAVAVVDVDLRVWTPRAAALAWLAAAATLTAQIIGLPPDAIGSDSLLYAQYSADLLLRGVNPYGASMLPAFDFYSFAGAGTPTTTGDVVDTVVYPAGAILAYVPQLLLGFENGNATTLVALLAVLGFLILETPREYALAPVLVLLASQNILNFAAGGVIDALWVLPVLVSMAYWRMGRLRYAGVWFGLAAAVKQQPWFIAPFLLVWLYRVSDNPRMAWWRIERFTLPAAAGFLAVNLPFILWDAGAWVRSVGTAFGFFGPDLVQRGSGLVILSLTGTLPLESIVYTAVALGFYALLLSAYAREPRVAWLAWIAPAFLFFFTPRGTHNYFIAFLPVAYYAALAQFQTNSSVAVKPTVPPQ